MSEFQAYVNDIPKKKERIPLKKDQDTIHGIGYLSPVRDSIPVPLDEKTFNWLPPPCRGFFRDNNARSFLLNRLQPSAELNGERHRGTSKVKSVFISLEKRIVYLPY